MEKCFIITAEYGLHARPVTKLVDLASHFQSEIFLKYKDKEVNLKSVMGVMSLGVYNGQKITIIADGNDQKEVIDKIAEFIENEKLGILA